MSVLIENYYLERNIPKYLIDKKIKRFDENLDISKEFELWITSGKYQIENPVEIEGYSAKSLSEISHYLDGEGAFMLLIELRENSSRALKKLKKGFKFK